MQIKEVLNPRYEKLCCWDKLEFDASVGIPKMPKYCILAQW